ncbi:MAG: HugZ family protein [Methyloligella sp. ZOD6]
MSTEDNPSRAELAADARSLLRRALKGALATLDSETGGPYASLVTLATDAAGCPTFLISTLARHTKNLVANPRASILVDGTDGLGNPLEGARVSVHGKAEPVDDEAVARRFVARHQSSAGYAGFNDFGFWRLKPEGAHYIGGFGRILDFAPEELLTDISNLKPLFEAEEGMIAHMNEDHADAIELYATQLLGAEPGHWRMVSCDSEGCDLQCGAKIIRLPFDEPAKVPEDVHKALVNLAQRARAKAA